MKSEKPNGKSGKEGKRPDPPMPPGSPPVNSGIWLIRLMLYALIAMFLLQWLGAFDAYPKIPYSVFKQQLREEGVERIAVRGERIRGYFREETEIELEEREPQTLARFETYFPAFGDDSLIALLEEKNVSIDTKPERKWHGLYLLIVLTPLLLIGLLAYAQYRTMQGGGGGGIFGIGRSRAKPYTPSREKTTFKDVAGAESAKDELQELVAYLQHPEQIHQLGGKLPKGILLLGPPGCGKTLVARAVAGEAGVPFYIITGSDFMEMFVGVGASRVRDLFKTAKATAPSIVFIDEIDSIGRQRGSGLGGGHDEREQTLNQLLSEMDGFEGNENVIVMAATNRPDVLDPALRRPGRFDRQVVIPLPKQNERQSILRLHAQKKTISREADLDRLAQGTPGFSGADLENLLNEAALLAGRKKKTAIENEDLDEARDKVLLGLTRRGLIMSDEEKRMIAHHEAGHAIVSVVLPEASPVHKISVIPRTHAMGVTESFPREEKYVYKREFMLGHLAVMMGGRCAEELIYNTTTTGAEQDLKQATQLARRMVLDWGMSEDFMNIALGRQQQQVFLGQELSRGRDYSEATAREVDLAVKKILTQAHDKTMEILKHRRGAMDQLVEQLLANEEVPGDEVKRIVG